MKTLFLFYAAVLVCTQPKEFKILDSLTKNPIPEALVTAYLDGQLVKSQLTNKSGIFLVNSAFDSLDIRAFGYNQKSISKMELLSTNIYLEQTNNIIQEVVVSGEEKTLTFGNYKTSGSEIRAIGASSFAMLFSDEQIVGKHVHSIILNFKEIFQTITATLEIYGIKMIERIYDIQKTHLKIPIAENIPDENKKLASIIYVFEKSKKNVIVEIDVDSLNISIPVSGIAISIRCPSILTESGKTIQPTSLQQLPKLFKHRTKEFNYCEKISNVEVGWQNINQVLKTGEDNDNMHPLFPMKFYEPSIGLSIEKY